MFSLPSSQLLLSRLQRGADPTCCQVRRRGGLWPPQAGLPRDGSLCAVGLLQHVSVSQPKTLGTFIHLKNADYLLSLWAASSMLTNISLGKHKTKENI